MNERERRKIELLLAGFAEAMEAWNWSRRTIESYRHQVRQLMAWLDAETDVTAVAEITPEILGGWQTALLAATKPNGEPLAASTRHLRLTAVKAWFRWLAREAKLLVNPAAGLTLPKTQRKLPAGLLSPKETARLIDGVATDTPLGLRDRAILEVLYATGIRNAELGALKVADVDPATATLAVRGGKGNKDRVVPLGPQAAAAISAYLAEGRPALVRKPSAQLFLTKRGGNRLDRSAVTNVVKRAAKRAGITKPVRPHSLRHACATHMLQHGADIRHIQRLLGHASLQTTQVYTRVEIGDLKRVHRKFHPREWGG